MFRTVRCSFCRRSSTDVAKLVAGARDYICERCAHEAVRIMDMPPPADTPAGTRATVVEKRAVGWTRTWHFATTTS